MSARLAARRRLFSYRRLPGAIRRHSYPVGFGSALAIPTITAAAVLLSSVRAERAGTASGVLNTCRQLGGALAVAVFGALIAQHDAFVAGMQVSLMIATVLLAVTAAISLRLRDTTTTRGVHAAAA